MILLQGFLYYTFSIILLEKVKQPFRCSCNEKQKPKKDFHLF